MRTGAGHGPGNHAQDGYDSDSEIASQVGDSDADEIDSCAPTCPPGEGAPPGQWCSYYNGLFEKEGFNKPNMNMSDDPGAQFKVMTLCSGSDAPVAGRLRGASAL